jgi:hypothetical protein
MAVSALLSGLAADSVPSASPETPDINHHHHRREDRHGYVGSDLIGNQQAPSEVKCHGLARMRQSWKETPIKWSPLPIAGGVALLVVLNLWKQHPISPDLRDGTYDSTKDNMPTVKGPWQASNQSLLLPRVLSAES